MMKAITISVSEWVNGQERCADMMIDWSEFKAADDPGAFLLHEVKSAERLLSEGAKPIKKHAESRAQ